MFQIIVQIQLDFSKKKFFCFPGRWFKAKADDILIDYKMCAEEVWKDLSSGNIKANTYLAAFFAAGIFFKANPTEADLENSLLEHSHQLSLVSSAIRNKESDSYIDSLRSAQRQGRLHYTNLGLMSLVWVSENRDDLDLYEAQCKHTRVAWYDWFSQVVDVGVLGKFVTMSRKMENYDVNEEEWKEK